jgi:hypothetical protein
MRIFLDVNKCGLDSSCKYCYFCVSNFDHEPTHPILFGI